MLQLRLLHQNPSVNEFYISNQIQMISGESKEIIAQFWNTETDLRYIPAIGATFSTSLLNSDTTTISPAISLVFPDDDRSIITFSITAAQSENLISQDIIVTINEGTQVKKARKQTGISKIALSEGC